jgi:hypothetical protein
MVPQVTGLKYPSGMCILYSPFFSAIDAYNKKQGKWNPELNSVFAGFAKAANDGMLETGCKAVFLG